MSQDNTYRSRILIADDSPTVLNILQVTLEEEGYEVIPAMDGLEAMNKACQESPDLVVLDIFMPKINGYQVCRLLKNDELTSHIPIIMLTGSERGDKFWSLETGADEFQTKDFEFLDLINSIQRLLSNRDIPSQPLRDTDSDMKDTEPDDEVEILSKLSQLLDRELYKSTIEKIRLETILDSLGEGVLTIDADKEIIAYNKSLRQMTGMSYEEVSGKRCDEIIDIPLCNGSCLFDKAMENEGLEAEKNEAGSVSPFLVPVTTETEILDKNGKKIPVNLYLTLLRDHVNKTVGAVCVFRDITRMKEIERMNDELSKAYEELQNAQAQLVQSEKMASLGRLVAGAAHELNNPISFIYSNVSHLRQYIEDMKMVLDKYSAVSMLPAPQIEDRIPDIEKFKEKMDLAYTMQDLDRLVDDIDEGARRTKGIVEDLKTFSRSEEGRIEDTDINEDMEKSLNLLVDHYKGRIIIHKDFADLPRVKCYANQLSRVFMNLITNACQAIDGSGDIWITTKLENGTVIISIRDNGLGMDKEHLSRIFDPFFTTKDVGEGAGLGLSISYGIIQRHKGEILVDSKKGSGTAFTIRMPTNFEAPEPSTKAKST
jgi:PAS domain S-box-containing protein